MRGCCVCKYSRAELNVNSSEQSDETLGDNATVLQTDSVNLRVSRFRQNPISSTRTDFKEYLTHPIKIYHADWTPANIAYTKVTGNLVALWTSLLPTPFLNKVKNFWYFRAGIRIRVVVQGAAQCYGQLAINFIPRVQSPMSHPFSSYVDDRPGANIKVLPHIIVDPSKNDTYEILLPVPTPTGFYAMDELAGLEPHGSYSMYLTYMNVLRSGTAAAPAAVRVCIYMSLDNPVFEGMTTVLSDFVKEKKASDILSSISSISGVVAPATAEFAPAVTLFSQVTGGLSSVLRWFGYAKPPQANVEAVILNRTCDNYSQTEGTSTAIVLGCSQKQSLSLDPSFGGSSLDDMSVPYICSLWGLVGNGSPIPSTAAAEACVWTFPVTPTLAYGATQVTPMGGIAKMCLYWAGDLEFRFEFVASAFTRATILIAWDPYKFDGRIANAPAFGDALTALQNTTVQVVGNTVVDVTIPYKSIMPALFTSNSPMAYTQVLNPNGNMNNTNGTIYMYMVNPIVDNGGASMIDMNVYLRSENIAFLGCKAWGCSNTTFLHSAALSAPTHDIAKPTKISFGEKSDLSTIHLRLTGDPIHSVKDLACRMQMAWVGSVTGVGDCQTIRFEHSNFLAVPTDDVVLHTYLITPLCNFIAAAYNGYRGSVKFSVAGGNASLSGTANLSGFVTRQMGVGATNPIITDPTATIARPDEVLGGVYAFTTTNLNVSSRMDYNAPMINMVDFMPTRGATTVIDDITKVAISGYQTTNGNFKATLAMGAGDDLTYLWFLGWPIMQSW